MVAVLTAEQERFLASLSPWEKARARWLWLTEVADSTGRRLAEPRVDQHPPPGSWRWWFYQAGRGSGKTRGAAEDISDRARRFPGCRIALVSRRLEDVRQVMVEGESGLLSVVPPEALRGGSRKTAWNRGPLELVFVNGSTAKGYSSEEPSNLRGPQHHFAWGDEPQDWDDARAGNVLDTTFNNLDIGLRLPPHPDWPAGYRAQGILTGTPKAVQLIRDIRALATVTRGSTYSNLANLDPEYADAVLSRWKGTRLERQELLGELVDEVEGALIAHHMIDNARQVDGEIPGGSWRALRRRLVMIDPSFSGKPGADECGICVGGMGTNNEAYILADLSGRMTPSEWARTAVTAWREWDCDAIGYEAAMAPEVVKEALQAAAFELDLRSPPRLIPVPVRGQTKMVRLERVSPLYEQGRVHHVGTFPALEDQLCSWTPDDAYSPDRLDACVHLLSDEMLRAARPMGRARSHVARSTLPPAGGGVRQSKWVVA
jgi:phage terminase large subunit-like protein